MPAVRGLATDPDPAVRRAAYEAELRAWPTVQVPVAAAMNAASTVTGAYSGSAMSEGGRLMYRRAVTAVAAASMAIEIRVCFRVMATMTTDGGLLPDGAARRGGEGGSAPFYTIKGRTQL